MAESPLRTYHRPWALLVVLALLVGAVTVSMMGDEGAALAKPPVERGGSGDAPGRAKKTTTTTVATGLPPTVPTTTTSTTVVPTTSTPAATTTSTPTTSTTTSTTSTTTTSTTTTTVPAGVDTSWDESFDAAPGVVGSVDTDLEWELHGGQWRTDAGTAKVSGGWSVRSWAVLDEVTSPLPADHHVTASLHDAQYADNDVVGIAARMRVDADGVDAYTLTWHGYWDGGEWRLHRFVDGSSTLLARSAKVKADLADGTVARLEVRGDQLLATVNGASPFPMVAYTDTFLAEGGAGIFGVTGGRVDDFVAGPRGNRAPLADAGRDLWLNDPVAVSVDGSASSDDGTIAAWNWRVADAGTTGLPLGTAAVDGHDRPKATIDLSGADPGAVQIELVVTDDAGSSAADSMTIHLSDPSLGDPRLATDGAVVRTADGDGERIVFRGVNLPYANPAGWQQMTDALYTHRVAIFDAMDELGVNAVRLGLHHTSYEAADDPADGRNEGYTKAEQIERIVDVIDEATARGMYVWIEAHGLQSRTTADVDAHHRDAWPMLDALFTHPSVVDNEFVLLNAMNEPGDGFTTWSDLERWYREWIDHFRRDLGYDRLLILDGRGWSHQLDDFETMDAIEAYDAAAGAADKIVWSHHRYPGPTAKESFYADDLTSYQRAVGDAVTAGYAVVVGEFGDIDSGPVPRPQWFREFAEYLVTHEIPRGHNGGAAWAWGWHPNNLTSAWTGGNPVNATSLTTLSELGETWRQTYLEPLR